MGCSRTYTKEDHNQVVKIAVKNKNRESIDQQKLNKAVSIYQQNALEDLIDVYNEAPEYINAVVDCLNTIADVNIEGVEDIIKDLSLGGTKAAGAEFMLNYVYNHKDEIKAVEVPRVIDQANESAFTSSGIDILKNDGTAVELKNYNFYSPYYRTNASSAAKSVAKQAFDRINNLGISQVEIVFSGWNGGMPKEFQEALQQEIGNNEKVVFRIE